MKLLEERILKDGQIREGSILKVDAFLNHQLDIGLMQEIGKEFARIFADAGINKILTIEASGIAIASIAAQYFGNVPVVFAKKAKSKNLDGSLYTSVVHSYTYGKDFNVTLSQKFLGPQDNVLVIDDFLASGKAMKAENYALVQKLAGRFKSENGSIVCRELLAGTCPVSAEPQPSDRTAEYYRKRPCSALAAAAASYLAEEICGRKG